MLRLETTVAHGPLTKGASRSGAKVVVPNCASTRNEGLVKDNSQSP